MNYYEFNNKYYNPDSYAKKPGENENWKMLQRGFKKIESELATPFIITFTNDAATQENPFGGHIDKSRAEIEAAFSAGSTVFAHLVSEALAIDSFYNIIGYWYDDDGIRLSILLNGIINGTFMIVHLSTPETDGDTYGVQVLFNAQ